MSSRCSTSGIQRLQAAGQAVCAAVSAELPAAVGWHGVVHSIYLAPAAAAPTTAVTEARAVAGRGLEGDRYFDGTGTFSGVAGTGRHLTLIELEAIRALLDEEGIELDPGEARRNVVTCGVPLNHLVGREFLVGDVRVRGMRLCEPCSHLSRLAGRAVRLPLVHRGGLRADLLSSGTIRAGDAVVPVV
jgi:MOSC domain-containing protein YiiM